MAHWLKKKKERKKEKKRNSPANTRDMGSIPGTGRSPGEGNDNRLQNFCLGVPCTGMPSRLMSLGSQRVRHNLATKQKHLEVAGELIYFYL